jgi:transcriptional regulator with XRE-family HTH domain
MERTWLKEYRIKRGYLQKEVAEKVNISQQYYSYIESGKKGIEPKTAQAIAKLLKFKWTKFYE